MTEKTENVAEVREAQEYERDELKDLLRQAYFALHVWDSQDYDLLTQLKLRNQAADLRCEIAARIGL